MLCQLSAPPMHKVKTGVQNMYMKYTGTSPKISVIERLSHLFICCCVQVEFISSHNCKVCTRCKFAQCYTCHNQLSKRSRHAVTLRKAYKYKICISLTHTHAHGSMLCIHVAACLQLCLPPPTSPPPPPPPRTL